MSGDYQKIVCIDNQSNFLSIYEGIENDDLVLTLDQDVIELCKENYLPCVDIEKILQGNELIKNYEYFTNLLIQVKESIKVSYRDYYYDNDMDEAFDWFFYPLKINLDQILLYKII